MENEQSVMGSVGGDHLDHSTVQQALKPVRTKRSAAVREDGNGRKPEGFKEDEEEEEEEALSPIARVCREPCFNIYVMAIAGCKTRVNVDVFKANLVHTLLRHPRFSSLQVKDEKKGGMKYVPVKVDLDKHVIESKIHCNGDDSPDKLVEDYVSDLSKTSIDDSKPLWELHILNIKTSNAESIVVFRIHHSIGDGTSLMSLLLACTRQISNPKALPTLPVKKTPNPELIKSRGLWWRIQLVWNTIIDVLMFFATIFFLKDTMTPLNYGWKKGGETGAKRFVYRTISLDDVKFIKNTMNTTINDVVMGVSLAGLSQYLNRRYGEATKKDKGETQMNNNLPKNIRLRAALVMNIRPLPGLHALAEMMEKGSKATWGNWFGCVLLPMDVALHDNPLDYVRQTKIIIDRKKHSLEAVFTHFLISTVLKIFGAKVAALLYQRIFKQTTMCFSNVVGPMEEIGFYGHPMAFLAPFIYGQPNGLTIHFQSYVNKMTIALSVDEEIVPDPHELCDDLEKSLKLIKDAIIARGLIKKQI